MVSIYRQAPLDGAPAVRRCVLIGLGVAALFVVACGSADSNFASQTNRSGTGGASGSGGFGFGGAPAFGGTWPGTGGVPIGAGGIIASTGGWIGTAGAGGAIGAGGFGQGSGGTDAGAPEAGGSDHGTGGAQDAGPMVNPFPSGFGFLISKACSDCASVNCQEEERVCAADPACVAVGQCIAACLGPTCLACITTLSNQTTYNEFVAVTKCTDLKCQPTCPFLNIGGGGVSP